MFKKLTAYSFILIANIMLLAHAVIPHHHHQQQVCIERTHCATVAEAHNPNTAAEDHQHDGDANSTPCLLKQAFLIRTEQIRILDNCDNCTNNHHHDFCILANFEQVDFKPFSEVVVDIPEFSPFFISFVTTSLGLRAPPIV